MHNFQRLLGCLVALSTIFVVSTSSSTSLAPGQILIPAPSISETFDATTTTTTLAVSEGTTDPKNATVKTDSTTDVLKNQYNGILLINYAQTSCGVVFASSTYGYTAANCLIDSQTNTTLDVTTLGIALYGPDATDLMSVVKVTTHPSFDANTLANNVAVLQFQTTKLSKRDSEKNSNEDSSKKRGSHKETDNNDDNTDPDSTDSENAEEESTDIDEESQESSSVKESKKDSGGGKNKDSNQNITVGSKVTTAYSLSPISSSVSDWKSIYYIRRTMASVPKRIWTPLQAKKSTLGSSDQVCTVGSAIYAANTDAMLCSNVTMPALASENQKCQIPLSIVYGVQSPSSAGPLAIYSHSVVFGSGICSNFSQRHYYTLLGNYLEWGASVVSGGSSGSTDAGVTTSVASMTGTKTPTISTEDSTQTTLAVKAASVSDGSSSSGGFSMNIPSGGSQEIYVYGGNLYPLIEAQGAASDAQISPTTTITVHVTSTVFAGGANTGTATSAAPSENEISTPAPTGTDMSGMTGTDMSGMTGTDMSGMTGTDMSGMTGTDMSGMTGTDMLGMTGTDMSGMTGTDMSGMTGTDMSGMTGTDMSGMTGTDPTGTANTSDSSAASNSSNDNVVSSDVANIVTVNTLDSSDMSLLGISDTNSSIDSKSSPTESSNGDETGTNSSDASASPTDTSNPDKVEQSNNQAKTSSMSTAAKVAIAVVVLLGIGAFGGGYWFYTRRRKKQQQQNNRRLSDSI